MRCAYCNRRTRARDEQGDPACQGDCGAPPRTLRRFPLAGNNLTVREIATATGIPLGVLSWRLSSGWDVTRAATTPTGPHGGYRGRRQSA